MKKLSNFLATGIVALVILTGLVAVKNTLVYKEDTVVTDETYEVVKWKMNEGYGARYLGHDVDEVTRDMVSYPMFTVEFIRDGSGTPIVNITQR